MTRVANSPRRDPLLTAYGVDGFFDEMFGHGAGVLRRRWGSERHAHLTVPPG
jgi:hypothetical protein